MKVFLAVSVLVLACTVMVRGTPQTEKDFLREVLGEMKSKKTAELKTQDYDDYDNIGEKRTAELNIQQDDDYDIGGDDGGDDTDGLVEAMANNFSFEDDYNKNVLMAMLMTESLEEDPVKAQGLLRIVKRFIKKHLPRLLKTRFGRYLRRVICSRNGPTKRPC